MAVQPFSTGPGILFVYSRVRAGSNVADDDYDKWYREHHIQDVFNANSACRAAWRYRALDAEGESNYLAIYSISDLKEGLDLGYVEKVPLTHEIFGWRPVYAVADFDTRYYRRTKVLEKDGKTKPGRAPNLVVAAMQQVQGGDEKLNQWEQHRHLKEISKQPGWRRSSLYELVFQSPPSECRQRFLVLHEFEEGMLPGGNEIVAFEPANEWSRRRMGSPSELDAGEFRLISSHGDQMTTF